MDNSVACPSLQTRQLHPHSQPPEMRRGDLYRRRLDVPAAQERRHRAVQAAARHKRHLLGRHVPAVDRHRRRGVRDGEVHSEIRPRRLREAREPEPAPRRQGRGDLAHPRHRAREGEHQDELDPLAGTAEADRRGEKTQSDKAAQIKSGFG